MGRVGRWCVAWITLVTVTAACVPAQTAPPGRGDSIRVAADSIAARLAQLEKDLALLRQQVADESRMSTRTRSRIGLTLSARMQLNVFANTRRVNTVDVPQLLSAPPAAGNPASGPGTRTLGMSLRQSRIGAAASIDSVLGGRFEGDFDLDFFGGVSNGPGDRRLFPEPRLRTARAHLQWTRTELMIGSESPLISGLNPISMATVGVPGFATAGNLWNWLPQIRVTHELFRSASAVSPVSIAIQGAALAPFSNAQHVAETDAVDAGERSGRPFLQSRARVRWGATPGESLSDGEVLLHGGEFGVSTHYGWVRTSGNVRERSQAIAADAQLALPGHLELRGEAYRGQLLRGLGGGGIGQNFGRPRDSLSLGGILRNTAGWLQLNALLHPTMTAGIGCGADAVNLRERPVRERNTVCAVHALYRPSQPVFMSFEYRTLQTRYSSRSYRGSHFNLAFGFEL